MDNPLVSVILSVYNGEKYLAEAIESILNQTYINFEFIIIDDGSTDKSLEIIASYDDKRIVLVSRENRGLIASLNEGIEQAKGKYIARMDADDISLPNRLEEQIGFMKKNIDIGVCGTAIIGFGEEIKEKAWKLSSADKSLKTELLFSSCFAHPTVMIRRDILIDNNLYYNENYVHAEDFELWTQMEKYTKFANLKNPLLRYRVLEDSISRVADKNIEERYLVIKSIFEIYLKEMDIQNTEEENRLHFNLTVNTRMKDNLIEFTHLKKYFSKIVRANNEKQVFDKIELKKVLGKKWLWNIIYRKDIMAVFSQHVFYGLWSMMRK